MGSSLGWSISFAFPFFFVVCFRKSKEHVFRWIERQQIYEMIWGIIRDMIKCSINVVYEQNI